MGLAEPSEVFGEGKQKGVRERQLWRPGKSWFCRLLAMGTRGGWLQRRDTLPGRGRKQGWNHVPCCPGQYNCIKKSSPFHWLEEAGLGHRVVPLALTSWPVIPVRESYGTEGEERIHQRAWRVGARDPSSLGGRALVLYGWAHQTQRPVTQDDAHMLLPTR